MSGKKTSQLPSIGSGVDYSGLDPFKKLCQEGARLTDRNCERLGITFHTHTRGESAQGFSLPDGCQVFMVDEGLGTKNIVADEYRKQKIAACLSDDTYYPNIMQCTGAMSVNDLITERARPFAITLHIPVGSEDWFADGKRNRGIVDGMVTLCNNNGLVWAGGETPALKGMVDPERAILKATALGIKLKGDAGVATELADGDAIIILTSSGVHANGLTTCRNIAAKLPDGYLTPISNKVHFGAELLTPTIIYAKFVEECLNRKVPLSYLVNGTGHAWSKLMRHPSEFTYVINHVPLAYPIFEFIQEHAGLSDEQMYGSYNMGLGFAVMCRSEYVDQLFAIAMATGYNTMLAGTVVSGPRQVVIAPRGIVLSGDSLDIR